MIHNYNLLKRTFATIVGLVAFLTPAKSQIDFTLPQSGTVSAKGTYISKTALSTSYVPTTTAATNASSIEWTISEDGVLTIKPKTYITEKVDNIDTQLCPMPNYATTNVAPWYKYRSKITSIKIESGITNIGNYAFYRLDKVTSVTFGTPNKINYIGSDAFNYCSALTSISLPDDIIYINSEGFYNCSKLTNITLPAKLQVITSSMFRNCSSLVSITIPSEVKAIKGNSFWSCSKLKNVDVSACTSLYQIEGSAFNGCSVIENFTIPKSVTSIASNPFYLCPAMKNITVEAGNTTFKVDTNGYLTTTTKDGVELICVPAGNTSSTVKLQIPSNISIIRAYACSSIKSSEVEITQNLDDPDNPEYGVEIIRGNAFYNATNLEKITLGQKTSSIENLAFYNCSKLKSIVTSPKNTTMLFDENDGALYLTVNGVKKTLVMRLPDADGTTYILPETVENIRGAAFQNNTKLTSIDLKQGKGENGGGALQKITGGYTFKGCTNLTSLYFPSNITEISTGEICSYCSKLTDITFKTNAATSFGWGSFISCTSLKEFNMPSSATSISGSMFSGCTALEKVNFPVDSKIKSIGENAFNKCTALKSITLPKSLEQMNGQCFNNCSNLETVEIGNNMASFGYMNFQGCKSLKTIKIKRNTPPKIQPDSFDASIFTSNSEIRVHVIVPCAGQEAYEEAPYYSDYFKIDVDMEEKPQYELRVTSNDEELGTVEITTEQDCNHNTVITATPRNGAHLEYWMNIDGERDDDSGLEKVLTLLKRDMTWTAYFFKTIYHVSSAVEDSDPVTIEYEDKAYYYNDDITIKARPNNGYRILSVIAKDTDKEPYAETTATDNGDGTYSFKIKSNVKIIVRTEQIKYKLNIGATTNGSVKATLNTDNTAKAITTALPGDIIKLVDSPASEFELASIEAIRDDGVVIPLDEAHRFTMPYHDVNITATFEAIDYRVQVGNTFTVGNFTYTVTSLEPNQVTVAAKDGSVEGDVVILDNVTYKTIRYDIIGFTNGGFQGTSITSVTIDRTTPPALGTNVFDSEIIIKVPCGSSATYTAAGYSSKMESITPYEYSVTVTNDGNGEAEVTKQPDCDDHNAMIVATPKEGYKFKQWSDGNKTNPRTLTNVSSNISLKASFEASDFNIIIEANEFVTLTARNNANTKITKAHVGDIITIEKTNVAGYQTKTISVKDNLSHSVDFNSTTNQFVMPASDVTITALCEAINYDIVIDSKVTNGEVKTDKKVAHIGEVITISTEPATGYKLKNITVTYFDKSTITNPSENKFTMKAGNATVSATFEQIKYNIKVETVGQCTASADKTTATYGSSVKITHNGVDSRYSLASVSIFDKDNKSYDIYDYTSNSFAMPATDVTVRVTYEQIAEFYVGQKFTVGNFTYTITSLEPKQVSVEAANKSMSGTVEMPSIVKYGSSDFDVVAITDNGFIGCSDIEAIVFNTDMPYTLGTKPFDKIALLLVPCKRIDSYKNAGYQTYFTAIEENYTGPILTVKTNNTDLGSVSVLQQQDCQNVPVAKAEPRKGCMLQKWSDNNTEETYIMTRLTESKTLTATFVKRNYDINAKIVSNTASLTTGKVSIYKSADSNKSEITAANYNTQVTIDCTPITGYELSKISAKYKEEGGDIHDIVITNGQFTMPDANVNIEVTFIPIEYKIITENTALGVINVKSSAKMDERITITATPDLGCEIDNDIVVKTVGGDLVTITNGAFFMPASDVIVTASFKKTLYKISIDKNIENGSVIVSKTEAIMDDNITVTATPRDGYKIASLRLNDGTEIKNGAFKMPAKNVEITATFIAATYSITVEQSEGGSISAPKNATFGSTVDITNIKPDNGYEFVSVVTDKASVTTADDKKSANFIMPASNVIVTPSFRLIDYNISIADCEGGKVTVEDHTATMGQTVTLNIISDDGYQLKNISSDETTISVSGDKATFTMPAKDVKIKAEFEKTTFTIKVGTISNGKLTVVGNKTTAKKDETITVAITPNNGYHFVLFRINGETKSLTSDNTFTMPACNVELTAEFSKSALGISVKETEGGTVIPQKSIANIGEEVALTIVPDKGYRFESIAIEDGLEGSITNIDSKALTAKLTMGGSNVVITAKFVKINYNISFTANDGNSVEAPKTSTYGEEITLNLTNVTGYELDKIEATGIEFTIAKDKQTAKFTMPDADVNGKVTFKKTDYNITIYSDEYGTVSGVATAHYNDDITLTITPKEGYILSSLIASNGELSVANDKKSATLKMPSHDVDITAQFEKEGYSITYKASEYGVISGPASGNYQQIIMIDITPKAGYVVKAITATNGTIVLAEDKNTALLTMDAAATEIEATYEAAEYTITYMETFHGTINGQSTAKSGEEVTITITPDKHYKLNTVTVTSGIITVSNDENTATLTMGTSDTKVNATFTKLLYPIVITKADNGLGEANKNEAGIDDEVVIYITPSTGYQLDKLEAKGATIKEITSDKSMATIVVTDSEVIITPSFIACEYNIIVTEDANAIINAPEKAKYGEEVIFTVEATDGYEVKQVMVNNNIVTSIGEHRYSFEMPASDIEIVAVVLQQGSITPEGPGDDPENPHDPENPECQYYTEARAKAMYNWLLVVDKNSLAEQGYEITDDMVTWYMVVEEQDDPCVDGLPVNDKVVKHGLYLTSETNLIGTGDYYAVIETDKVIFRTQTFFFKDMKPEAISLAPTRAYRGQTLKIRGLEDEANIMVFDTMGRLIRTMKSDGQGEYQFQAEDNNGLYIVKIISGDNVKAIKYIVK